MFLNHDTEEDQQVSTNFLKRLIMKKVRIKRKKRSLAKQIKYITKDSQSESMKKLKFNDNDEKIKVKLTAKTLEIFKHKVTNLKMNNKKNDYLSKKQFEMINDLAYSIVSKQVREKEQIRKKLIQINYQDNALMSQV